MKTFLERIHLPMESMTHLFVCLLIIFLFVFAAIIPDHRTKVRLDQKIREVRMQLTEHKSLLPFYQSLTKAPAANTSVLIVPVKTVLQRDDIDGALMTIRDISVKAGMEVVSVVPDLSIASIDPKSLAVNITLKGSFANFRSVLARLGALPYADHLEELSIQRGPNARFLDFKIKIVVSLS